MQESEPPAPQHHVILALSGVHFAFHIFEKKPVVRVALDKSVVAGTLYRQAGQNFFVNDAFVRRYPPPAILGEDKGTLWPEGLDSIDCGFGSVL
jgi:hypothetical protein